MNDRAEWGVYRPQFVAFLCIGALRYRIARGPIKKLTRKILRYISPQYDVEVDGLKMRCHVGDNSTENSILERKDYKDRFNISIVISDLMEGDVFVDVGANCGFFTIFAARKVGPSGHVVAIEPIPKMLSRLKFNIGANGFSNVDIFETAVGTEAGTATIHVREKQHGQSSISPVQGYVPMAVPITTLLTVIEASGVKRINAMKIDIEGYEDRALVPFIKSAPRSLWPHKIFMETAHEYRWETDCVQVLIDAGYRRAWSSKNDVLLVIGNNT